MRQPGTLNTVVGPCWDPAQVHMVFDGSNMWANVQREAAPWKLAWDLRDAASWRPFFGDACKHRRLGALQPAVRSACLSVCMSACDQRNPLRRCSQERVCLTTAGPMEQAVPNDEGQLLV
jgi:hypothetical protein